MKKKHNKEIEGLKRELEVGNCMGNPWVSWELPIPIPFKTHTHIPMGWTTVGMQG
jgi:hypothetical protein